MASINLKHTSGNGTILNSPAANPSSDITLKLPSTTGSAGQVLKVASANHSSTNAELEFAAEGSSGKILQVIQTKHITAFSTTSTSPVEYAGINTTITPSSASNKILINVSLSVGASGTDNGQFGFLLYNGSSEITDATNTNVTNETAAVIRIYNQYDIDQLNMQYLYSSNTTSATTIKVYVKGDTNRTLYLNRYGGGTGRGGVSSMILMEVAA